MHSVTVEVRYSPSGREPNQNTKLIVHVDKLPATESEVTAFIKRKNPKWNFFILSIKQ